MRRLIKRHACRMTCIAAILLIGGCSTAGQQIRNTGVGRLSFIDSPPTTLAAESQGPGSPVPFTARPADEMLPPTSLGSVITGPSLSTIRPTPTVRVTPVFTRPTSSLVEPVAVSTSVFQPNPLFTVTTAPPGQGPSEASGAASTVATPTSAVTPSPSVVPTEAQGSTSSSTSGG